MSKKNLENADSMRSFYKTTKLTATDVLSDPDFPLWAKVLNKIILNVEFEQGYVSTTFVKHLAKFYRVEEQHIRRAITKLIEKMYLLKYPYGCKRAKGYMLNPERFWVGSDESQEQKIRIYRNSMNKLIIDVDITGETEVEINMTEREKLAKYTSNYKDLAA